MDFHNIPRLAEAACNYRALLQSQVADGGCPKQRYEDKPMSSGMLSASTRLWCDANTRLGAGCYDRCCALSELPGSTCEHAVAVSGGGDLI